MIDTLTETHNFFIRENQSLIYRTRDYKQFRFSFEREFDFDKLICPENIERMKLMNSNTDSYNKEIPIKSYPFIILDKPTSCKLHPNTIKKLKDPNMPNTEYLAFPVSFFFENLFIWLYVTKEEYEKNLIFKPTTEYFHIPKAGNLYKFVFKSIKTDLGETYKNDMRTNLNRISMFKESNQLWKNHYNGDRERNGSKDTVYPFDSLSQGDEFMILDFDKPYYLPDKDFDSFETKNMGGTYIQPTYILSDKSITGWIQMTVSRARYLLTHINSDSALIP